MVLYVFIEKNLRISGPAQTLCHARVNCTLGESIYKFKSRQNESLETLVTTVFTSER